MVFSIFLNKKLIPVLAVLILFLVLTIGSPSFSLFQNLVKTTDQSSFDELELRLPDVALAQSIGISICELDYQNINQIEITDYKKAIKGLSFLQKELNKNYKEDSLQSLITKILKNEYPLNENDTLCLPPLIISAKATEVIKGKEVSLASQKISCKGEAYLDNKYGITDSLVNYSAYLKNNKVVNKLNKNLKNLELKQKSLTAPKQINNTNKNILRTTLARNTAKFYLKHSDKLITFYESLCLQAPAHEEQEEQENENPLVTPEPTSPTPTPTPNPTTCTGTDTKSCNITNGTGNQTRTCNSGVWSNYGTCTIASCNSGFQISGNTCVALVTSPFIKGDRVELINNTNFRKSPALTGVLIQQLPTGRVGTIVGDSPITNNTDTVTWRQVDFGLGQISYAGENNFKKNVAPSPSPVGCQNGTTTTREMYQNPSVPHVQACVPQTQTGTCVNGEYTNWTGTYTNTNCYVEGVNHCASGSASSISQFGITWTFNRSHTCGQYANGDYWVVGPVTIQNITPKDTNPHDKYCAFSKEIAGVKTCLVWTPTEMHGTMVNPGLGLIQSFDSRIKNHSAVINSKGIITKQLYFPPLKLPLTVANNSSILSSISFLEDRQNGVIIGGITYNDKPQMDTIAVLTVVASAPPANSFRPPYIGTDKTSHWNESQLDYSVLKSLAPVTGTPTLSNLEKIFERPWIELDTTWTGRYMHPFLNQPGDGTDGYGREIAKAANRAILALQLNFTNAKKRKLLVGAVQAGIDIYGAAKAGAVWISDGGHNIGRKLPMMLAGAVLKDNTLLSYADAGTSKGFIFQEDQQLWYVEQADVGRQLMLPCLPGQSPNDCDLNRPHEPYIQSDVGLPEWGIRHNRQPNLDGRNWSTFYRTVVGNTIPGAALAARLMGLERKWDSRVNPKTNSNVFFDYADRYFSIAGGSVGGTNQMQAFEKNMWVAYRHLY